MEKVVRTTDDNKAEKLWDHESESFVDYPIVIKPGVPLTSQILLASNSRVAVKSRNHFTKCAAMLR